MMRRFIQMCTIGSLMTAMSLPGCVKAPDAHVAARAEQSQREAEIRELMEQANSFSASGDYTRAEQYLNLALSAGGQEADIVPQLVKACVQDQRYRDALQYLENFLRRHPSDHKARFVLGSLQMAVGNFERAKKELEKVVEADPSHADAHYALAVLSRDDIANYAEADRQFREYLHLRPDGAHAEEARGSLLVGVP